MRSSTCHYLAAAFLLLASFFTARAAEMSAPDTVAVASLTGQVVDDHGQPLSNATVRLNTWNIARSQAAILTTDATGHFTWKNPPVDNAFVDVVKPGYGDERVVRLLPGQPNVIHLLAATPFTGTVVDADTGAQIPNFRVVVGLAPKDGARMDWDVPGDVSIAGKDGQFNCNFTASRSLRVVRVQAEGYRPADSDPLASDGASHAFTFRLTKGPGLKTVLDAHGKPVADAQFRVIEPRWALQIELKQLPKWTPKEDLVAVSDADGHFALHPSLEKYSVIALAEAGYAVLKKEDFEKDSTLALTPWARIEGDVRIGTKLAADSGVELQYVDEDRNEKEEGFSVLDGFRVKTKADAQGHFVVERALAQKLIMARSVTSDMTTRYFQTTVFTPKAGETLHVLIGGVGRPVTGRGEIPADVQKQGFTWWEATLNLHLEYPRPVVPPEVRGTTAEGYSVRFNAWLSTPDGQKYKNAWDAVNARRRRYDMKIEADGTFRTPDVLPGVYDLNMTALTPASHNEVGGSDIVAVGSATVTVPNVPGGVSDEALNIGKVAMASVPHVSVGDTAPDFTARTLDGKELKLSDFRGRYVVLDFWAVWCEPCLDQMPHLKSAWSVYGTNPRFAMLSLSLDDEASAPAQYVKAQGFAWPQAFLGNWDKDPVTKQYAVHGLPSVWLIDPDGKVVSKNVAGSQLIEAVGNAMNASPHAKH